MINLKVKKLGDKAVIPKCATDGSACFDLTATSKNFLMLPVGPTYEYGTELAFEIPKGHVGISKANSVPYS